MENMRLTDLISNTQIKLEKAMAVNDSLYNDYFTSDTPDLQKIACEFHNITIFESILGDYLFEMEESLTEAMKLIQKMMRPSNEKENAA